MIEVYEGGAVGFAGFGVGWGLVGAHRVVLVLVGVIGGWEIILTFSQYYVFYGIFEMFEIFKYQSQTKVYIFTIIVHNTIMTIKEHTMYIFISFAISNIINYHIICYQYL